MQTQHNNSTENIAKANQSLVQKIRPLRPKDIRHIFISMRHAARWSQMKRRFEKQRVIRYCQRNWTKAAAAALIFGFGFKYVKITPIPAQQPQFASASFNAPEIKLSEPFSYSQTVDYAPNEEILVPEEEVITVPPPVEIEPEPEPALSAPSTLKYVAKEIRSSKKKKYIDRFGSVAQNEMDKYHIPASILLGIAALHSNFGHSPLAEDYNNHTGILCDNVLIEEKTNTINYNNNCHASFQTAWSSFRALSLYLSQDKLNELQKVAKNDYKVWASGLEKMGFIGSIINADELIKIIEEEKLYQLDK